LAALPKPKQKAFIETLEALQEAAERAALIAANQNGVEKKTKKSKKDKDKAGAKKRAKR
jgi:hypothetical protein